MTCGLYIAIRWISCGLVFVVLFVGACAGWLGGGFAGWVGLLVWWFMLISLIVCSPSGWLRCGV